MGNKKSKTVVPLEPVSLDENDFEQINLPSLTRGGVKTVEEIHHWVSSLTNSLVRNEELEGAVDQFSMTIRGILNKRRPSEEDLRALEEGYTRMFEAQSQAGIQVTLDNGYNFMLTLIIELTLALILDPLFLTAVPLRYTSKTQMLHYIFAMYYAPDAYETALAWARSVHPEERNALRILHRVCVAHSLLNGPVRNRLRDKTKKVLRPQVNFHLNPTYFLDALEYHRGYHGWKGECCEMTKNEMCELSLGEEVSDEVKVNHAQVAELFCQALEEARSYLPGIFPLGCETEIFLRSRDGSWSSGPFLLAL